MTDVTQLNDIKSPESIELMDRLERAIINTPNLTPIEIVGMLVFSPSFFVATREKPTFTPTSSPLSL